MDRLLRRSSESSSTSDPAFKPFTSPDGHVGQDLELDDLPARLQNTDLMDKPAARSSSSKSVQRGTNGDSSGQRHSASFKYSDSDSHPSPPLSYRGPPSNYDGSLKIWTPPPPISASIYGNMNPLPALLPSKLSPKKSPAFGEGLTILNRSVADDRLRVLRQEERNLQIGIQFLLDAQSDGLQAGLGGDNASASVDSTGSNTSTASKSLMPSQFRDDKYPNIVQPVRQPKRETPSLSSARSGILMKIGQLAALKIEEEAIISADISTTKSTLQTIDSLENKKAEFLRIIQAHSKSPEAMEFARLKSEQHAVDGELRDLEVRLQQTRLKKQHLARRLSTLENSIDAGVSSYSEGLKLVEKKIDDFLSFAARPGQTGFWQLPQNRRTLNMARVFLSDSLDGVEAMKEKILHERRALTNGGNMWAEAVSGIAVWEDRLRHALLGNPGKRETLMQEALKESDALLQDLEKKEIKASDKKWNLLVVAIGAEISTLKKSRRILREVLRDFTSGLIPEGCITEFNGSFIGEGKPGFFVRDQNEQHRLSALETDRPQSPREIPDSTMMASHHNKARAQEASDKMAGSGLFKNGSISVPKTSTPPFPESPRNGDEEAMPAGVSKMTASGRLAMSWRNVKAKLDKKKEKHTTDDEDEGQGKDLLVGEVGDGDDVE